MSQDKKARLLEAAAKAKAEIDAQLNRFMEKLDKASDDPSQFITMSQLELELHALSERPAVWWQVKARQCYCSLTAARWPFAE